MSAAKAPKIGGGSARLQSPRQQSPQSAAGTHTGDKRSAGGARFPTEWTRRAPLAEVLVSPKMLDAIGFAVGAGLGWLIAHWWLG